MSQKKSQFSNADEWRQAAMGRAIEMNQSESGQRAKIAASYNQQHGISDADALTDQQLYIQGKMELEEYQRYLLFKHSIRNH